MVSLELFKKCIQHIKAQQAKDEVLSDVLVCEDSRGWVSTAAELIDDVIDLIAEGMTGEDTDDWISWYLWEYNEKMMKIYSSDDRHVIAEILTDEDLWEYLNRDDAECWRILYPNQESEMNLKNLEEAILGENH